MCSKPTSITNKLSENLPFYNCTTKIFYSLILKNTDKRKKIISHSEQRRILFNELPFFKCSDYELISLCMSTKEKLLQLFESNNFSNQLINNFNTIKENFTCNYFNESSFQKVLNSHNSCSLKMVHTNIRSINKNKAILKLDLETLNCDFDLIFLSETGKAIPAEIEETFQNYKFFLDAPRLKRGSKGGSGILVNKNSFDSMDEIFENDEENLKGYCKCNNCIIENKWLKLTNNKKTYIVASIYRHPNSNIEHFVKSLDRQLNKIDKKPTCILAGDINIDLLKTQNNNVNKYIETLLEFNFTPCITIPTRLTETSATVIDHINIRVPSNKISYKVSAGNLINDITDHLPNIVIMDEEINTKKNRPWIRLFNKKNIKNFEQNIESEPPLLPFPLHNDVNIVLKEFSHNLNQLLNKYFPLVRLSRKKAREKPFINNQIKKMINKRNQLYYDYIVDRNNKEKEKKWKQFRNQTTNLIRNEEIKYYKNQIITHGNNCQAMWKTLGNILNNKRHKSQDISSLVINNEVITDKNKIVQTMNNYLCGIGEKLANQHNNDRENEFEEYLNKPMSHSMYMSKITTKEIANQIKDLDTKKASGQDGFTAKFLKICQSVIEQPLTHIYNLSILSGNYPQNFKIAKCIPIYKKGKRTDPNNYRPISILNCMNKIYEKLLYNRMYEYLTQSNILYKYQFGFRQNHSTTQALIEISDNLKESIDKKRQLVESFLI